MYTLSPTRINKQLLYEHHTLTLKHEEQCGSHEDDLLPTSLPSLLFCLCVAGRGVAHISWQGSQCRVFFL
jgi:hypothetical protein